MYAEVWWRILNEESNGHQQLMPQLDHINRLTFHKSNKATSACFHVKIWLQFLEGHQSTNLWEKVKYKMHVLIGSPTGLFTEGWGPGIWWDKTWITITALLTLQAKQGLVFVPLYFTQLHSLLKMPVISFGNWQHKTILQGIRSFPLSWGR